MIRYGQTLIGWGTPAAPQIATGNVTSYSLRDAVTRQLIEDMVGEKVAAAVHSRKGLLQWSARVVAGSTNWLDLSAGAALTVSTISGGVTLATRAVERWVLGQPKTISIDANWYPAMTQASPTMAGITNSAFTPTQTGLTVLSPGASLIYGTFGMTQSTGIIHGLTLTQILEITADDPDPSGGILGAASHGYMRELELELLATAAAPAVNSTLVLTNGPTMTANFQVESVEPKYQEKRGVMYSIKAFWIPPFTS
jgi:hypothetical protein